MLRASRGPSCAALRGRDRAGETVRFITRAGILPDGNAEGEGHKAVTSVCEGLQGQSTEVEEGWGEVRCGWGDGQGKGLEV